MSAILREEHRSDNVPMPPDARVVLFLLPERFELLDLAGPLEVFSSLPVGAGQAYQAALVATKAGDSASSAAGINVGPVQHFSKFDGRVDTLLVVGGPGALRPQRPAVVAWLQDQSKKARRIGSICTGAFVLAQAGLLRHRQAVTHWRYCERLQRLYPDIQVNPEPIFVKDGRIYSTAGVSAGIDLALALVEEDHGYEVATAIARDLVLFLRRPGPQHQLSCFLDDQLALSDHRFRNLSAWVAVRLGSHLDVRALAAACGMSPRTFARRFSRTFASTPAAWVQRLRVDAAGVRLRASSSGLKAIAHEVGFANEAAMRSAFLTHLGFTPQRYRARFVDNPPRSRHQRQPRRTAI
jgi:transcriptional regulator GlxA family with amidase domain